MWKRDAGKGSRGPGRSQQQWEQVSDLSARQGRPQGLLTGSCGKKESQAGLSFGPELLIEEGMAVSCTRQIWLGVGGRFENFSFILAQCELPLRFHMMRPSGNWVNEFGNQRGLVLGCQCGCPA